MTSLVSDSVTDDGCTASTTELVSPVDLLDRLPVPPAVATLVERTRDDVARILAGHDPRLLVIAGPCSVHDRPSAIEYARRLRGLARDLEPSVLLIMRVYLEKPRTRTGWKGLINDPFLDESFRINDGLHLARQLLIDINDLGMPTATEFVDPITPQYVGDLVSWAAIGARTVESPIHRQLASGLSCPVGFKNGTSGDIDAAVNAVVAAGRAHHFLSVTNSGAAAVVATRGNRHCHVILRGGPQPNFDERSIEETVAKLTAHGARPRLMIDCSHGNCRGSHLAQLVVARELSGQIERGSPHILGVMLESNLFAGRQNFNVGEQPIGGLSITDACIGFEDTVEVLRELATARSAAW